MNEEELYYELIEQRSLLSECDDFIANFEKMKRESINDINEVKKELDEAKEELRIARREYTLVMQKAELEHYDSEQKKNFHSVYWSIVDTKKEWVDKCKESHDKHVEILQKLTPELLAQAKIDRSNILMRLNQLEKLHANEEKLKSNIDDEKKYQWIGFIVIIIIIVLAVKACGG